jgi:HSP20 family protein
MSMMRPYSTRRENMSPLLGDLNPEMILPWGTSSGLAGMDTWGPAVDVIEEPNRVKVKAHVPGIQPENLNVEVTENTLTLSGESRREEEEEQRNVYRREIAYGRFYRQVPLPTQVDANKANADFENGVLTVTLPKAEEARRHRIKVGKS